MELNTALTRTLLLTALIAASVMTVSHIACAQNLHETGYKQTMRGFGPHRIFKLLHRLDVDRDQRRAIGEIMDRHRPQMREFMFDMMDGKKALQAILTSPDYDPTQIETLAASQAKNAEKMFLSTAKTFAEISAVLTPEQRTELAEMMDRRGQHRWRHDDHERPHHDDSEPL